MKKLLGLRIALSLGLLTLSESIAWAQTPLSLPDEDGGYLPWAIAGGIAAMVLTSAFLNPHRSHLNK